MRRCGSDCCSDVFVDPELSAHGDFIAADHQ
jgi:hypothetical protein